MSTESRTELPAIESPAQAPADAPPTRSPRPKPPAAPPLRNGDHLTAPEFERRYDAMPHLKKAELIEGVVYIPSPDFYLPGGNPPDMPSPVSYQKHAKPHSWIMGWLVAYSWRTPGTGTADNSSVRMDLDTIPQPDGVLLIEPSYGGRVQISPDDYIVGGPELVAEVAYSSVSFDLHRKFHAYRRNGVREYMVWRTEDQVVDWFVNREGRFEPMAPTEEGLYRSEVFPGLWLPAPALVSGDTDRILAVLNEGLASPEHAAFVARLNETAQQIAAAQRPAEPPPEPLHP